MKKYLNVGNAFLKREPQQSLIYEAARRGIEKSFQSEANATREKKLGKTSFKSHIEKSFQSEANATGVTYILDFLKNYLNLDNKKVFANYIDCVQNEEFFNDKSTFIFEYDEKENTILLSSQKHDLIFRNILPDDYIPKKYFLYPFIISTSPKNEFELHIYN